LCSATVASIPLLRESSVKTLKTKESEADAASPQGEIRGGRDPR
jgi:hypothetical protein